MKKALGYSHFTDKRTRLKTFSWVAMLLYDAPTAPEPPAFITPLHNLCLK
jgi:hypothetical protein